MRQVGVIAAGALHALRHHRARLAEDHARAARLASEAAEIPGLSVEPGQVETNIVVARLADGAAPPEVWVERLRARGVGVVRFGARALRLVTHLDVDDAGLALAVRELRAVAAELAAAGSTDSAARGS
jgi:threonine aldolase